MKLLVLLEVAYDRGELAKGWSPGRWRTEFEKSRTGIRAGMALWDLERYLDWKVHYANACPGIANGPDHKLPACLKHTRRAVARVKPDYVLACGKTAESAAVAAWGGPLMAIPHPSYRLLTNALLTECSNRIGWWGMTMEGAMRSDLYAESRVLCPRFALRQRKGYVKVERLPIGEGPTT